MPAKKHPSQIRRRHAERISQLPSEGREGKPPKWPFEEFLPGEKDAWAYLWSLPQAVKWEWDHLERVVARYCRLLVRAEQPGAGVSLQNEVRQLEDRLALNSKAMFYQQIEVAAPDIGPDESPASSAEQAYLRAVGAVPE